MNSRAISISIHALREEGDARAAGRDLTAEISIHALREEGDTCTEEAGVLAIISIHALREEGDPPRMHTPQRRRVFLSTPSARRATKAALFSRISSKISIHALREEGDLPGGAKAQIGGYFYPRPPRGGRLFGGLG